MRFVGLTLKIKEQRRLIEAEERLIHEYSKLAIVVGGLLILLAVVIKI